MVYLQKLLIIFLGIFSMTFAFAQQGPNKEIEELLKSANQGNEVAQATVGSMYITINDYQEAEKWLKLAAEQGNTEAAYNLAVLYDTVNQDYEAAFKWYTFVAEKGDSDAQTNIGVMYENGQGVTQNYQAAFNWFIKAAKQGNVTAQANLGKMYYLGKAIPKDLSKSYMWLVIAKLNDKMSIPSNNLLAIEKEMSEAEMESAKTMIEKCKNSNYQDCD